MCEETHDVRRASNEKHKRHESAQDTGLVNSPAKRASTSVDEACASKIHCGTNTRHVPDMFTVAHKRSKMDMGKIKDMSKRGTQGL